MGKEHAELGSTRGKEKLQSLCGMYIIILKTRRNKHRMCGKSQKKGESFIGKILLGKQQYKQSLYTG